MMGPIKNHYWSELNGMQKARQPFAKKAHEFAVARIRLIEIELPNTDIKRRKEIEKRFLSVPIIMLDYDTLNSDSDNTNIESHLEAEIAHFADIEIKGKPKRFPTLYSSNSIKVELVQEALVLQEQIVRYFYWHEYHGHKISLSQLPDIEHLIIVVRELEISERGFSVIQNHQSILDDKAEQRLLREVAFADDIDQIIFDEQKNMDIKKFNIRDACKVYLQDKNLYVTVKALQTIYSQAKKIRIENYRKLKFRSMIYQALEKMRGPTL